MGLCVWVCVWASVCVLGCDCGSVGGPVRWGVGVHMHVCVQVQMRVSWGVIVGASVVACMWMSGDASVVVCAC